MRPLHMHLCLALFAAFAFATVAQAGPITSITIPGSGCGSCEGATLYLSVEDNLDGTFTVLQSIDSTNYNEVRLGMNQVGFLAIKDWTMADLISAPTAGWLDPPVEASTSANSLCTTGTSSDKVCTHGFVNITANQLYTWEFLITGGTLMDTQDWHWGGQFADAAGATSGKIVSESIPEPSAAVVFGLGALLVSGATRRRGHF